MIAKLEKIDFCKTFNSVLKSIQGFCSLSKYNVEPPALAGYADDPFLPAVAYKFFDFFSSL